MQEKALQLIAHICSGKNTECVLNRMFKMGREILTLECFISLVRHPAIVISADKATVPIFAATQTPRVVLYINTNPRHTPYKLQPVALPFNVAAEVKNSNEIIQFANKKYMAQEIDFLSPEMIVKKACSE